MTARGSRLVTLDEFLAMPETEPYTELVNGELCRKPVPKKRHSRAQTRLSFRLQSHPATAAGSTWVEMGNKFPRTRMGNLRVPDVSFYFPERMDPSTDEDYPERAPDLAAEVRSKGQSLQPLRERLSFLREQGTACTLLIDPEARTVEVHDGGRESTAAETAEVTLDALKGFSFKVADLFA
jgi:Uma2 family endonuclease